ASWSSCGGVLALPISSRVFQSTPAARANSSRASLSSGDGLDVSVVVLGLEQLTSIAIASGKRQRHMVHPRKRNKPGGAYPGLVIICRLMERINSRRRSRLLLAPRIGRVRHSRFS